ncbi:MAG: hydrogenase nickel incorporation protein HypB [Anaerolineae bacterium]|nr:hydrogenase nickel incorporation protein HypB [Anaerolineae bacterium]
MAKVTVIERVTKANDQIASENQALLDRTRTRAVNLMASPGAGKTSLLMRTVEVLGDRMAIGAIEGDTASQVDADRVATTGIPVVQINTGGGCRLDANMLRPALQELPLDEIDLLLIENVGNLVCPAGLALGQHLDVVITSVPEGDDKPYKYPGMFTIVDAVVINKTDLLPYLEFDVAAFRELIAGLNPNARVFEVSCRTGEGLDDWTAWLVEQCASKA